MGTLSHLDELEAEAIYIMREVAAECEKPVMLYSIGKDSSVMLHLAMKAFYPEKPPFPFMHIDTTWKFKEMIQNQGGDPSVVDQPERLLTAKYVNELPAKESGIVSKLVANELGIAAMMLGAGRKTKDDAIDHAVGLKLNKKIGDPVQEGESLLTIYSNEEDISSVKELLYQNIEISDSAEKPTLIHDIITE